MSLKYVDIWEDAFLSAFTRKENLHFARYVRYVRRYFILLCLCRISEIFTVLWGMCFYALPRESEQCLLHRPRQIGCSVSLGSV